jgi:serine/threonine protein kinase
VESDELRKQGYTLAADLWSLGVLTACLLTGTSLIPRKELSQLSQLEIADRFLGIGDYYKRHQWISMAPRAQRFLRKLLTTEPAKRMTATEALCHSWFKKPYSEGTLLEERYHKIIRFWKKREGDDEVIEYIRDAPPQSEKDRQGPKFRKKIPDTSLSPYFSLDRHLFQRPAPTRKVVLASLAESGSAFVVPDDAQTKPIANKSARRARGISVISVNAKDMFGKSHDPQTAESVDDGDNDEIVLVPTEPMPHIESLNLKSPVKTPISESEGSQVEHDEDDESRESKRARKESWDPEDRRIHDAIAKELPRYSSARMFRDTIKTRREADRKENIRPSYVV